MAIWLVSAAFLHFNGEKTALLALLAGLYVSAISAAVAAIAMTPLAAFLCACVAAIFMCFAWATK